MPVKPQLLGLHTRMRRRRAQLGLTGTELAERAGISTSYVSLIETGGRVPDEDVAARLAQALQDDAALYRAWARAARLGIHDLALLNQLEAIARTPAYVDLVESGEELPRIEPPPAEPRAAVDLTTRLRDVASRLRPFPATTVGEAEAVPSRSAVVGVPVLAEGQDPQGPSRPGSVEDRLLLDRRLVGENDPRDLFAYDVTPGAMKHLRGVAGPGDRIVFRRGGTATPDRICAVRTARGIVLARALVKDGSLLLLPGEGDLDFDSVPVPDAAALSKAIAGTHVLLIRL